MSEDKRVLSLFGGVTGQREVDADTVEVLEDLLERAKSGEIVGVVAVNVNFDGTVGRWYAGDVNNHSTVGALAYLQHMLMADRLIDDG